MAGHIVLLGDSIFDNGAYIGGRPDVVGHLRALLPAGVSASLLAVDGATTAGIPAQLKSVPADVTHAVVSIGGNDALRNSDILNMRVSSTQQALRIFAERVEQFEHDYARAIAAVTRKLSRVTVCTIYNGNLPSDQATAARIGLMMFNDAILRVAFAPRLDVIDLRSVCTEPFHYANPIEPSDSGGAKIARAIAGALGFSQHPGGSRVFV